MVDLFISACSPRTDTLDALKGAESDSVLNYSIYRADHYEYPLITRPGMIPITIVIKAINTCI